MEHEEGLNKRLPYLPISILGRIELWLTYRNLKNASSISLRKPFDLESSTTKRTMHWLADAGIFYQVDGRDSSLLHVAKTQELAKKMSLLQWSKREEDILFRGIQYGFPEKAVRLFSANHEKLTAVDSKSSLLADCYWKPYVRFMVRIGHEKEDSLVAKNWADIIENEVPIVGRWFEKKLKANR